MNDVSPVVRELRLARERSGWTQEQLAEKMHISASLVNKVERGVVPASTTYVDAATSVIPPDPGIYRRIHEDGLRRKVIGDWLRDWFDIEQQATSIRWFEPDVLPGLVQTESYARTVLRTDDPDETESRVAARMERQRVLARDKPPSVVAVVDESVLHRRVGSPEVMYEQLMRLAEDRRVMVQVLPSDAETYAGCDGSFVLAVVADRTYVYVATPARGFTLDEPEIVSGVQHQWEILRGEALPPRQSRALILKAAEQWSTRA